MMNSSWYNRLIVLANILFVAAEAFQANSNYLDSLSSSNKPLGDDETTSSSSKSNTNDYLLNSLMHQHPTLPLPLPSPQLQAATDLKDVAAETPIEHYAKENPGAGWAGYKHPMFGGYLDNLKNTEDETTTTTTNTCILEEGKEADYGDDIRWGAQVYLDNLK